VGALSEKKTITILGSTGSVGTSTLDLLARAEAHGSAELEVVALTAGANVELLAEQALRWRPKLAVIAEPGLLGELRERLAGSGVASAAGGAAVIEAAGMGAGWVMSAIMGAAGLPPTLAAVRTGAVVALANKESLVCAGPALLEAARAAGGVIIPVDSEHSAIFQAMACGRREQVREVILTASGGPFRGWERERIERATVEDALNHPTWRMGKKITIDSATMFNKGLELIEACWLFDLPPEMVRIVIHPESIVHSMVEFVDGNVLAQLSPPDMKTPIQYALTYPDRVAGCGRRMNWAHAMTLHFSEPDYGKFPALGLARKVAQMGGTAGAVMNAANEAAVGAFLGGKIQFGEICRVVELTIGQHRVQGQPTLDDVLEADRWARTTAAGLAETLKISEIPSCP
jgi:1-deoxy-D-xylulose-5-phosphate reductoisomerase